MLWKLEGEIELRASLQFLQPNSLEQATTAAACRSSLAFTLKAELAANERTREREIKEEMK